MHIGPYSFGSIVIDGATYTSDLIIVHDSVIPDWWRKQGHSLSIEDLQPILEARPSVLVIGCGASAIMKVPTETTEKLQEKGITAEILPTQKAVERFNELTKQGKNAAAALHLTC